MSKSPSLRAVVDARGNIIWSVYTKERTIDVATGGVTRDGSPVRVRSYRVSRARKNLDRLSVETPLLKEARFRGQTYFLEWDMPAPTLLPSAAEKKKKRVVKKRAARR